LEDLFSKFGVTSESVLASIEKGLQNGLLRNLCKKLKTKTTLNRLASNFQNAQTGEKNFVDDIVAAGMKISKIPSMKSTCFDCERDTCQSDQFLPK